MNLIKINAADIRIRGNKVRIEIVRDSAICRWLTKGNYILLFNTLYIRSPRLTRTVLMAGMADVMKRDKIGYIRYYWSLLTADGK